MANVSRRGYAVAMTAHRTKPTITPERIRWFADYYAAHCTWGCFHVCLDDGNYTIGAVMGAYDDDANPDVVEAAAWFDQLSPSQRKRLGQKAEAADRRRASVQIGDRLADSITAASLPSP